MGVLVEALGRARHLHHGQDLEGSLPRLLLGHLTVDEHALGDLAANSHGGVE